MILGTGYYTYEGEVYFHDPDSPVILAFTRTKDLTIIRNSKLIKCSIYPDYTTNKRAIEWIEDYLEYDDKIVTPGGITLSSQGKTIRYKTEFIYFVYNPDSNAIKIGKAKNVHKRIKCLQTGTPAHLKLVKAIDVKTGKEAADLERSLHKQFKHLNLIGEWFRFDHELQQYVKRL